MERRPWFDHPEAIDWLATFLRPHMHVWEWGSGGSTLWFADRCAWVVAMEHDRHWYDALTREIPSNATLLLSEPSPDFTGPPADGTRDQFAAYVAGYYEPRDVVLIDGRARVACAERVAQIGGDPLVFLDNCDRPEYAPIWERHLEPVERVGNLMQLRRRK